MERRYDVYLTKEPSVYEAMALVHSRVRRVVFGIRDFGMGGLSGGSGCLPSLQSTGIHTLPGTNHHYRAFRLNMDINSGDVTDERMVALMASLRDLHCNSDSQ